MIYKTFGEAMKGITFQGYKMARLIFLTRQPWYYKGVSLSIDDVLMRMERHYSNNRKMLYILRDSSTWCTSQFDWENESALQLDSYGGTIAFIDPYKAINYVTSEMNNAKRSEMYSLKRNIYGSSKEDIQDIEKRKKAIIDEINNKLINDNIR